MAVKEQVLPKALKKRIIPINNQVIYDGSMMSRSEFIDYYIAKHKLKVGGPKGKRKKGVSDGKKLNVLYDDIRDLIIAKTITIDNSLRKSYTEVKMKPLKISKETQEMLGVQNKIIDDAKGITGISLENLNLSDEG